MARRLGSVEPFHSPFTGRCTRPVREAVEEEMAAQGLTYVGLAKRRGMDESSARQFFHNIGARGHNMAALAKWSIALNKPGDWLLKLLREHELR